MSGAVVQLGGAILGEMLSDDDDDRREYRDFNDRGRDDNFGDGGDGFF